MLIYESFNLKLTQFVDKLGIFSMFVKITFFKYTFYKFV